MNMLRIQRDKDFTGQAQRLVRLTASGIFDRRIGPKDHLWMNTK